MPGAGSAVAVVFVEGDGVSRGDAKNNGRRGGPQCGGNSFMEDGLGPGMVMES